ncbi:MAG: hypothetical protein ACXAEF_09070 [Candidatus Thorarchaeota archaeon]|jgi:hypothetical protein
MELNFKCPECSGNAKIEMSDGEAEGIRARIVSEGRSPTMIVRCESNHELLVTLYNLRSGEGLGVRDVVVPIKSGDDNKSPKSGSKEVDFLAKAFGGDD